MRWPDGPCCLHCGTGNVQCGIKHKSMAHRCRECPKKPMFSIRIGTIMQGTRLKYREWAIGLYLYSTRLKGISSMNLHRELGITQKSAWFLLHRLRAAAETGEPVFAGPVEADETYIGRLEKNKNAGKKLNAGRGGDGKTAVACTKDRETNKVAAKVVSDTKAETLEDYLLQITGEDALLYTDDNAAYAGMDRKHKTVRHSVGEYVRGREEVHTNGMESFWAMLRRTRKGVYHKMSKKHMGRYVKEFVGRYNVRKADMIYQVRSMVCGVEGKRLRYVDLKADNGLPSGAHGG